MTKYFKFSLQLSAVFLFFISINISAIAHESGADGNTNQTPATPTPAKTPFAPSDIILNAEIAEKKLQGIQTSSSISPSIRQIAEELPKLKQQLDLKAAETTQILTARPSLETLRMTEQDWLALTKNIAVWKKDLKAQIGVLDRQIEELKSQNEVWQKTLDALKNPSRSVSENTENSNISEEGNAAIQTDGGETVPPEILRRIDEIIAAGAKTQKQVEAERGQLLTLQTRVSEQETRINDTLKTIKEVREEALSHLFVQDSPPIWNAHRTKDSVGGVFIEAKDSYAAQIGALNEYGFRQSDGFVLHAIIFLTFFGLLIWARRRIRPLVKEDAELQPAFSVFEMPIAGALILSIMLSGWIYPQAPRILSSILGAAALIPGIIYLRKILEKPLFPILNAMMIFYFIDMLRQITATMPLLSRILFLAEMLGAIVFLIWFLRSKSLSRKIEVRHQRIFIVIKKAIPYFLALFGVALIANLLGYVSLSNVIGNGVLSSSYIALILYTAIQIIKSLIVFALRVRPFSNLGIVKNHRSLLQAKIFRVLTWLGIIIWGILTLNLFSIRETLFNYLKDWLTAELVIGSIAISLSDIIIFVITVWLAFALSRLIRFILEEDVYTRVNLAGGVPYAISTMLHYLILVIGFVTAIAALGFDLTKFTILAGAFGVGLGFGLQTIVNNFVSGLILLFERPVKVGDTVQLGEHQGDLNGIGLRASVVRKVDGSEVIVPNSKLISEEVINWTLSDQQRRIDINIGVAYGNDPEHIIELLTEIAVSHENILETPPPRTLFTAFGENSLEFQLRAWTDDTVRWVIIKSEIAVEVHKTLNRENIEIPFPQRDLNLKIISSDAAEILKNGSVKYK